MGWFKETEKALEKRGREEKIARETRAQTQQKELESRLDTWKEKLAIVARLENKWKEWEVDKMVVEIKNNLWPDSKIGKPIYCFPPKHPGVEEIKLWKININEDSWRGDIHEYLSRFLPNFLWARYDERFYGDRYDKDLVRDAVKTQGKSSMIRLLMSEVSNYPEERYWVIKPADDFNDPYLRVEIRHMVEDRERLGEDWCRKEYPLDFDFCLFADHIEVYNQIIPLDGIRDGGMVRKKIDQYLAKHVVDGAV